MCGDVCVSRGVLVCVCVCAGGIRAREGLRLIFVPADTCLSSEGVFHFFTPGIHTHAQKRTYTHTFIYIYIARCQSKVAAP